MVVMKWSQDAGTIILCLGLAGLSLYFNSVLCGLGAFVAFISLLD